MTTEMKNTKIPIEKWLRDFEEETQITNKQNYVQMSKK